MAPYVVIVAESTGDKDCGGGGQARLRRSRAVGVVGGKQGWAVGEKGGGEQSC